MVSTNSNPKLREASLYDFALIYGLGEIAMRAYVESDLGDCFEEVALPAITDLLERGVFAKVSLGDLFVGAVALERHDDHLQL